ncbi:Domain of Uncharacterised Function with PDB structure [Leminorella grimontii]|nr:Domain of Uncharacterised Function with PDB structure [Leminorella grimontii]
MPSYKYRITVEPLAEGGEAVKAPVAFEVENHDDILKIVETLKGRKDIGFDETNDVRVYRRVKTVFRSHDEKP